MGLSNAPEIVAVTERPSQQTETSSNSNADAANPETIQVAKEMSKHVQADVLSILLPVGAAIIAVCIALVAWLAIHGPMLVPGQDTRITSIVISLGSRVMSVIISTAILRSAWACLLPSVLRGSYIPVWSLLSACQSFMSFGQLVNFTSLPPWFKFHVCLALTVAVAMTGTSASFRYESLPQIGPNTALIADIAFMICNDSFITNNTCTSTVNSLIGDWNSNTTGNSWSYIEAVNAGGQGTVTKYGQIGDTEIGSKVTLAILPSGWNLGENNLPWISMSVSCTDLPISAVFEGTGIDATATIFVNGTVIDTLNVPNMPEWGGIVHLYQQFNDSGRVSSLAPWKVVMLSRDLNDGGANFGGVAGDAATYLGNGFVALHGVGDGTNLQGILGAAAYCEITGDVGGEWPDIFWPPLNNTQNVVFGPVVDDRPEISTVLLNYGPSWQYSVVSENYLEGGSVSYIANNTQSPGTFAALFAGYIRNQWTLMAFSLVPQAGNKLPNPFFGSGPNSLYISVTGVVVLPLVALGLGLLVTVYATISTFRHRKWVNRMEFEGWWLVKALCPELYKPGYSNATEKDMKEACGGFSVSYRHSGLEDGDVENLRLWPAAPGEARVEGSGGIDNGARAGDNVISHDDHSS
jgi:hypothetical protein